MLRALVNGIEVLAEPKQRGLCKFCSGEMTSVCSENGYKVNHWRHLAVTNCDPWSEGETQWHLNWKSQFPKHTNEIIMYDEITGEKHIADVLTDDGIVIEFQNSPISQSEINSRIAFYKKMIWVVNGSASHSLETYFFMEMKKLNPEALLMEFSYWSTSKFFVKWNDSKGNVFIDFASQPNLLFWLKDFKNNKGIVQLVPKGQFVEKYANSKN